MDSSVFVDADGQTHKPALHIDCFRKLPLLKKKVFNPIMTEYTFAFPDPDDYLGCTPGQYVQIRFEDPQMGIVNRYISPTTSPIKFGCMSVVLRHLSGPLSLYMRSLVVGQEVEFRGPMGGFEYQPNCRECIVMVAPGICITPMIQIMRSVRDNSKDRTRIVLLYYADAIMDFLYKDELDELRNCDSRFSITYFLGGSRNIGWEGETGLLSYQKVKKHAPRADDYRSIKVIMCGGAEFLESMVKIFYDLSYPRHTVYVYGPYGQMLVEDVYGEAEEDINYSVIE